MMTDSKHIAFIGMVLAFAFFLAGLTVALLIFPPSPPQGWLPVLYPSGAIEVSDWRFAAYVEYPDVAMEDVAAWYADALGSEMTHSDECAYSDCFQITGEAAGRAVQVEGVWDGPGTPVLVWSGSVQPEQ